MARNVYDKIKDISPQSPELPKLVPADLQVNTTIIGAAQRGQQNKQLHGYGALEYLTKKMQHG